MTRLLVAVMWILGGHAWMVSTCPAAEIRTANFVVTSPDGALAHRVAHSAESLRRELSVRWLGREMPDWSTPCKVLVRLGHVRASGATRFRFLRGEVFGWQMTLQGPSSEVLESILPHELTHTILACRFRRPVPRWADEGAAVLAESLADRRRQHRIALRLVSEGRTIPLASLLMMTEYPTEPVGMKSLYAQGVSLVHFLVERGGRRRFLAFLDEAETSGWSRAIAVHYGGVSISSLEQRWRDWVQGGPITRVVPDRAGLVLRGQDPEPPMVAIAERTSGGILGTQRRRVPARVVARRGEIWRAPDPRLQPLAVRLIRRRGR